MLARAMEQQGPLSRVRKRLSGCWFACALLLSSLVAGQAMTAAGPWLDHEQSQVRLIAAHSANGPDLTLGLHFRLQPGWKVYWRTPGDAGFPPSIDWQQSENLAEARMSWPRPERFTLFGLQTFGYGDEVVFPIAVSALDPDAPLRLRGQLNYLICEEICIPYEGLLTLDLPGGSGERTKEAFLIDSFARQVPGGPEAAGLTLERAVLTGGLDDPRLEVAVLADSPIREADLLVEGPPGFVFDNAKHKVSIH